MRRMGGGLTLCLNSDFSSTVMVSALAMTGMTLTTLLRCFMNSRSSGRKLGAAEGGGYQQHPITNASFLPRMHLFSLPQRLPLLPGSNPRSDVTSPLLPRPRFQLGDCSVL